MVSLLFALLPAHSAPGDSGVYYPSAAPPEHTVRAGFVAGGAWWFNNTPVGFSGVDMGLQPVRGLRIGGLVGMSVGADQPDLGFAHLTANLPLQGNIDVAFTCGAGGVNGGFGGSCGILIANHAGRIRWDFGLLPLQVTYVRDHGWAEIIENDKTPHWDVDRAMLPIVGGVAVDLNDHWAFRVGVPDGFTFSYQRGAFYFDAGGASLFQLFGFAYGKVGIRM